MSAVNFEIPNFVEKNLETIEVNIVCILNFILFEGGEGAFLGIKNNANTLSSFNTLHCKEDTMVYSLSRLHHLTNYPLIGT